jgi:hypothetical protein
MATPSRAANMVDLQSVRQAEVEASRRHWLHRADLSFSAAQEMAEGPRFTDPGEVARYLKAIIAAAEKAECLTDDDREGFAYRAVYIERLSYERFLDHILELMRNAVRSGNKIDLPPLLTAFNEVIGHLRRLGLDDDGFARLKTKLMILLETAAPGGQQPRAQPEPVKLGNFQGDARLYVRYVYPQLTVVIGRKKFLTADWSLGGLLVDDIEHAPAPDGTLLTVHMGIEGGKLHEEQANIVRHWDKRKQLALRFRRFGSAMIAIKREAERRGMEPSTTLPEPEPEPAAQ